MAANRDFSSAMDIPSEPKSPAHPKEVWIEVLSGENIFDRTFRAGFFRAAAEAGFTHTRLSTPERFQSDFECAEFRKSPMIVAGPIPAPELRRELLRRGVPHILTGTFGGRNAAPEPGRVICSVDNAAVGRMAAGYFIGQGRFRSYAFVSGYEEPSEEWWSNDRAAGFAGALGESGLGVPARFRVLPAGEPPTVTAARFAAWVETLPRPLALLAANDQAAREAVLLCDLAGIPVPGEVAVLGVDDDAALCESAATPLSSIRLETERFGRTAFGFALRMLRGEWRGGTIALCPPSHVVERNSTSSTPQGDAFVARAVDWISSHAATPMSVDDVVAACGGSRRHLERRMRSLTGRSILDTIHEKRMGAVMAALRDTDKPLAVISDELGFSSPAALAAAFRRRYGRTMRETRHAFLFPTA